MLWIYYRIVKLQLDLKQACILESMLNWSYFHFCGVNFVILESLFNRGITAGIAELLFGVMVEFRNHFGHLELLFNWELLLELLFNCEVTFVILNLLLN
jgi:hypothetical protein